MRLTTSTAATLATAGLAALVTGCSSSSPAASGPVATHHVTAAAPAVVTARPVNPKAAVAAAIRASLAAHTVEFRYRVTGAFVHPTRGENVNPGFVEAGLANFDQDLMSYHMDVGMHAGQPQSPLLAVVIDGATSYFGLSDSIAATGVWSKSHPTSGAAADVLATQALQDVKGKVVMVRKTANSTRYQMQSELGQLIFDQTDGRDRTFLAGLSGTTQTEDVWVDRDGRIRRLRWTIDAGRTHFAGLPLSSLKAIYITLDLTNYGVDMVVPPHPTQLAAG